MTDAATITAALTGIKNAIEIAKAINAAGTSIAQAELKLRLADMLVQLADAKIATAEVQEALAQREAEISRLVEALRTKEDVVRRFSAYYKKGANGKAAADPFCLRCWEVDKKLYHIIRDNKGGGNRCPVCLTLYDFHESQYALKGDEPS